ncbi:DUF883 family protein [Acidimangrovimonas pyrenivorans]|uniref:YqjD family protein n=1 Tax=Acidimangrovimonas pyrenivorans TaxID=2030798 RepID=A0ABV7AC14_9RHOB
MATRSTTADKTETESPDLAAEVAELRRELESVAALIRKIGADGLEAAQSEAKARLAEGLAQGEATARKVAGEVRDDWQELESRVMDETRAHPWRTLGLAALAGMVLGLLLRR